MILEIVHKLIMTGFKRSPIIQMRPFCTLYNFISWSSVIVIFFHVYPSRKFAYWSNMFLRSSQFHFAFIINLLPFHLFPNKILQYCLYVNSSVLYKYMEQFILFISQSCGKLCYKNNIFLFCLECCTRYYIKWNFHELVTVNMEDRRII